MEMKLKREVEKIYYMLIKGISLTYGNMLLNGLSVDDVSLMLTNSIIVMVNNVNSFGSYNLVNIDEFRKYGIDLLTGGKVRDALRCFELCYKLDSSNKEICMQYLLLQLKKNNYEEVFKVFRQLENMKNVDPKFNNLILYLLNCITKLPKEYEEKASRLELEDISLEKNDKQLISFIYDSRFKDAYGLINNMLSKNSEYSVSLELIRDLLRKIFKKNDITIEDIKNNIHNKNYAAVVDVLRNVQTRRKLTYTETYIILICDAIVKIKETSVIPVVYETDSLDIYDLIISNNFEDTLRKLNREKEIRNELLYNLLVEVNHLIRKTRDENLQHRNEYQNIVEDAYGYIWLFNEKEISLEEGCKKYRLSLELSLLIRIIDVKDKFDEDKRKMFYNGLRQSDNIPSNVIRFLNEIEKEEKQSREVKTPVKKKYRLRCFDGKKEFRTKI